MFRARLQDAGTAALGALVAALVVLGCGGSGDTTTTATVTVGERTVTEPTPSTTPTIPTASLARRAERLVEQYYAAVDIGDYQSAWSLLSPELQSQLGGFYAWRDGYRFTIGTDVSGVRAIDGTARAAMRCTRTSPGPGPLNLRPADSSQPTSTSTRSAAGRPCGTLPPALRQPNHRLLPLLRRPVAIQTTRGAYRRIRQTWTVPTWVRRSRCSGLTPTASTQTAMDPAVSDHHAATA
jgi:hypothetical protein